MSNYQPYYGSYSPSGNGEQPVGEVELVAIEPVFEFEASSRNYSGIDASIGRCGEPRDDESPDEVLVVVGIFEKCDNFLHNCLN